MFAFYSLLVPKNSPSAGCKVNVHRLWCKEPCNRPDKNRDVPEVSNRYVKTLGEPYGHASTCPIPAPLMIGKVVGGDLVFHIRYQIT